MLALPNWEKSHALSAQQASKGCIFPLDEPVTCTVHRLLRLLGHGAGVCVCGGAEGNRCSLETAPMSLAIPCHTLDMPLHQSGTFDFTISKPSIRKRPLGSGQRNPVSHSGQASVFGKQTSRGERHTLLQPLLPCNCYLDSLLLNWRLRPKAIDRPVLWICSIC